MITPQRLPKLCLSVLIYALPITAAVGVVITTTALTAAESNRSAQTINLTPGFLDRTYTAVGRNSNHWVDAICATVGRLDREDYARFIRLINEDRARRPKATSDSERNAARHFIEYTTQENKLRAFRCLEQGAESAAPDTQHELHWLIRNAPQRPPVDPYKWLKKAADGGHPMAQYWWANAISHFGGLGGRAPADTPVEIVQESTPERHRYWLTRSAEAGVAKAQYDLARLDLGIVRAEWARGLATDIASGLTWLQRAANQSEDQLSRSNAAARLGEIYFTGEKVPRSYKHALRWFKEVDEKYMDSCGHLVWVRQLLIRMYRDGLGVDKDAEKVKEYSRTPTACS